MFSSLQTVSPLTAFSLISPFCTCTNYFNADAIELLLSTVRKGAIVIFFRNFVEANGPRLKNDADSDLEIDSQSKVFAVLGRQSWVVSLPLPYEHRACEWEST